MRESIANRERSPHEHFEGERIEEVQYLGRTLALSHGLSKESPHKIKSRIPRFISPGRDDGGDPIRESV